MLNNFKCGPGGEEELRLWTDTWDVLSQHMDNSGTKEMLHAGSLEKGFCFIFLKLFASTNSGKYREIPGNSGKSREISGRTFFEAVGGFPGNPGKSREIPGRRKFFKF